MRRVFISGATGSIGRRLLRRIAARPDTETIIAFSNNEGAIEALRAHYKETMPLIERKLLFVLGDIRDGRLLHKYLHDVGTVIHTAALKHVPIVQMAPWEGTSTNIAGTHNLIDASLSCAVSRFIVLSTDKAVNPINVYGATKMIADEVVLLANQWSTNGAAYSVVRYGNVMCSRGSVVEQFQRQAGKGRIQVTDDRMTRFATTHERAIDFILQCLGQMRGGEIFIPKLPSWKLMDLLSSVFPGCAYDVVGRRPGEKLHETLVSVDDAWRTIETRDHFVTLPYDAGRELLLRALISEGGKVCEEGFRYASDNNSDWLSVEDLRSIVSDYAAESDTLATE